MKEEIAKIYEQALYDDLPPNVFADQVLRLFGVIGRLSFREIEMLVQLKHSEDWEYGNDEKRCKELIEATRNRIGYTEADVKAYL
jgi:hypothetical protein